MTIKEYLKKSIKLLESKNITTASLDAEILVCFYLKKDKTWLYTNFDYKLNQIKQKAIDKLIKQRSINIPIAQITKHKEFYKLDFFINKNVLTPRPETELIVEEVLKILPTTNYQLPTTIVDIGVGSGAIIVSLAKNIKNKNIKFIGTEISNKALYVARKNSTKHKVNKKIKFIKGNLLDPIIGQPPSNEKLVITANLPYLTPTQFKEEKSIQHEPEIALISGKDGLKDYRLFFKQLKKITTKNKVITIIEFDPSQTKKLKDIIKTNFSKAKIQTKKDLCGLPRIMVINFNQRKK